MRFLLSTCVFCCLTVTVGCNDSTNTTWVTDAGVDGGSGSAVNHFVVSSLTVPANNNQAREFGLDLNGDGTIDNQAGQVYGAFAQQGFELDTTQRDIERGAVNILLSLRTSAASASVRVLAGTNPMPAACGSTLPDGGSQCGKHLNGAASFTVTPDAAPLAGLVGTTDGTTVNVGPGELLLPVSVFGANPVAIHLVNARIRLNGVSSDGGTSTGIVAGGITQATLEQTIYPAMQTSYASFIARDCHALSSPPECGCGQFSKGSRVVGLFDAAPNKDCAVSLAEIQGHALIQSLAYPDLVPDGGVATLSFGVSISAVPAAFTE